MFCTLKIICIFVSVLEHIPSSHVIGQRYFFLGYPRYESPNSVAVVWGFFYPLISSLGYLLSSRANNLHSSLTSREVSLGKEQRNYEPVISYRAQKARGDKAIPLKAKLNHIFPKEDIISPFRKGVHHPLRQSCFN